MCRQASVRGRLICWNVFGSIVLGAGLLVLLGGPVDPVAAQPPRPPQPANYKVRVRYFIHAARDQRIAQYFRLVAGLKKLNFQFVPPLADLPPTLPEDPTHNVFTGVIAAENARQLLNVPAVAAVQLIPADFALPMQADQRVQVQLELASGFTPERQLEFVDQLRALLSQFGFQEMTGYDERGYTGQPQTRLRGTIAVGELDTLLKDLRAQPTGWFAPRITLDQVPEPLRSVNPIPLSEVLADPSPVQWLAEPPARGEADLDKLSANLWQIVQAKKPIEEPLRVEVLLAFAPAEDDNLWRVGMKRAAPSLFVEGRLGNIVSGVFGQPFLNDAGQLKISPLKVDEQLAELARLDFVSGVRSPRPPLIYVAPSLKFEARNAFALEKSGLKEWQEQGKRGQGVRLAIVDSDFRGHAEQIKIGNLPKTTRLVDLTRERNLLLRPDPLPGDPQALGHGTQLAVAASLAAPEADLTLIRIDAAAPLMLEAVLDYVTGSVFFSLNLARRYDEYVAAKAEWRRREQEVLAERRIVLESFEDELEARERFAFLGPIRPWVFTSREWSLLRLQELEKEKQILLLRERNLTEYAADVQSLKGISILASALVWNSGYPLGERSPLTQMIDRRVRPAPVPTLTEKGVCRPVRKEKDLPPLWFQSVGNNAGQAWYGLYRDVDQDGVMEFSAAPSASPPGSWTNELNFLAWQPFEKEQLLEVPANNTLRISLQWTEPHQPDYFIRTAGKDWYSTPLAELRFVVLRQRDPQAKTLTGDDFEVVARSLPFVQRLDNLPNSATYEIHAEWTTDRAGRYAVRIERQQPYKWLVMEEPKTGGLKFIKLKDLVPLGLQPLDTPILPILAQQWELYPRLYVEAAAGTEAGLGRPVWRDYATDSGTLGVPADGRALIAVGAAGFDNQRQPYSSSGPPANLPLYNTPRFLAYDHIGPGLAGTGPAFGASLAAPFAAGTAAVILSAGATQRQLWEQLHKDAKDETPSVSSCHRR